MRSVLVGVLFFCYLMPVVAGDGPENYGTTPMDAEKFYMNHFRKLIDEEYERLNKSFETANETTPNASKNEMVSFVDNSTQAGINGTKKANELERAADGMVNVTMENVQGIKMDDLEENSTQVASLVDDSTQIEKNGNETTQLIDLEHDGDEMLNHTTESVTETKVNNSEEDLTQIAPSFLAQNEKSNEKYVKVENKVLQFLNDASVNVTVENNQLTLFVKDDNIRLGEQKLYVCFKSTFQSYASSTCPSGFCEVRVNFLSDGQRHTTYIDFDNQHTQFESNFVTAVISENSMKVTSVPNAPSPVTTCNPDFEPGYLPVKVINKGDKTVRLSHVQLFKAEPEEAMATGTIIGIAVGAVAFVAVVVGGFLFWWFCYHKKKPHNEDVEANIGGKQDKKLDEFKEEIEKKKEAVAPGLESSTAKKEDGKPVKDEKLEKKKPKKEVRCGWLIRDKPDMFPKSLKTVKDWELPMKKVPTKAEKKDSDEETTSKEESTQKQPKEKTKLEKKPAEKDELEKEKLKKEAPKKAEESGKKPIQKKPMYFKKKPGDSSYESEFKGGIQDSIGKKKAKPVEKKDDKKVEKVVDAKVEAAKPAIVEVKNKPAQNLMSTTAKEDPTQDATADEGSSVKAANATKK